MSRKTPMSVVLFWNMHQPEYRDLRSGEFRFPWTYLHAVKDYVDMAAHLEAHPNARAVVNFAPVLLDQIEEYAQQLDRYLSNTGAIGDPLLAALADPALPAASAERMALVKHCLAANRHRIIERFAPYQTLATMADWLQEHPQAELYVADQFLIDLLVWYHLGWMAETVRRNDARIRRLQEKAQNYTLHDRAELLGIIAELVGSVVPRYRRLVEAGQVELTTTPYAHPIVPLLLDFESAREAMPSVQLPMAQNYPGGRARARWHIERGIETFERHFGFRPKGCWPAEGAISDATLALLADAGFLWLASGESVLHNSLAANATDGGEPATAPGCRHRPYRFGSSAIDCFFRDDGLSDLIGFTYSDWHADDAVGNFVHALEDIAAGCSDCDNCAVAVILDGENAWEYYPENGFYFLDGLYRRLSEHPTLQLTTFQEVLDRQQPATRKLPEVVAGSWVYGTFSTWIGDRDKNRAWDRLVEAKRCFDRIVDEKRLDKHHLELATRQLGICEGSDWFWWFGDYNPGETVRDFERLFRIHLSNLYQFLGEPIPDSLAEIISRGGGKPEHGGTMRHGRPPGDGA